MELSQGVQSLATSKVLNSYLKHLQMKSENCSNSIQILVDVASRYSHMLLECQHLVNNKLYPHFQYSVIYQTLSKHD